MEQATKLWAQHPEQQYLDGLRDIYLHGTDLENKRTGEVCRTLINIDMAYDASTNEAPIPTTRKTNPKIAIAELLGYIKGVTSAAQMRALGTKTWDGNANEDPKWLANRNRQGDDDLGLIYGDSITVERAWQILERLEKKGFASCNTVFGIGSYTYQYVTRDSLGFAIKSTAIGVGNERIDIFKAPKTEGDTLKKSAKGLLRVVLNDEGNYVLEQENDIKIENLPTQSGELKPVYAPGFIASVKLSEITNRLFGR